MSTPTGSKSAGPEQARPGSRPCGTERPKPPANARTIKNSVKTGTVSRAAVRAAIKALERGAQ